MLLRQCITTASTAKGMQLESMHAQGKVPMTCCPTVAAREEQTMENLFLSQQRHTAHLK
jgi:hypothetical protein